MKIRRLSLQSWRGIAEREITFGDGVTLIEGANEIGKSTLVEALRMLIREQDSSRKKEVRAIQPVGEDVGSSVTAEIECGDVRFTYSKTYNRRPRTELHILAPRQEQLTGGDAHNRARDILDAHMDVALWETLLVEQGHALGAISLADSSGLAQALDTASGGQGSEGDGSVLLEAARAEYERYFTPSAGKERFQEQVADVERLAEEVAGLRDSLQALDDDLLALERLDDGIRQRQRSLPDLHANEQALAERWSAIDRLEEDLKRAQEARLPLRDLLASASEKHAARQRQIRESDEVESRILELSAQLEPRAADLETQRAALSELTDRLARLRQRRRQQQDSERRARMDLQYLADRSTLRNIEERLQRLGAFAERAETLRQERDAILVDDRGRRAIEDACNELVLARALRERTSTRMEIESDRELQLALDDEPRTLAANETLQRYLTHPLRVELPGDVVIRLTPGSSEEDPESRVAHAESELRGLLASYGVTDLADAITAHERRQALQRELEQLESAAGTQVPGDNASEEDLQARARQLQQSLAAYLGQRGDTEVIPTDSINAERALARAQSDTATTDGEIDRLERLIEQQREALETQAAAHRQESQELIALRARRDQVLATLKSGREQEADSQLTANVTEREAGLAAADARLQDLRQRLEAQDPETARTLLENAVQASRRARDELADLRQQHAIVESRLQRAQASGQQEALVQCEQRLAAAQDRLDSTRRRAAAARCLWERLNHFRDATQKAYVRPLQAQIERLGRIVFGPDFSLSLGDDWTIIACSRNGKTLPFRDLSIGAQEQLGILTRLAAAQIVARHGGVPVIIDDALGFSDPERLRGMGAAIAAAGRDAQVILLSCTPDRFRYVGSASVVTL